MSSLAPSRPIDGVGLANLAAVLLPGVLFATGLVFLAGRHEFEFLLDPLAYPPQLFVIALFGTVATLCGVLDWRYHRSGGRHVPRAEQRIEFLALVGGGAPLFALMCAASVAETRWPYVGGALLFGAATTVGIVYDETRYHRRCSRYEMLLHRGLVLGNGLAWLAWLHWCITR